MLRVNAIQCGAICLIALLAASSDRESNQERGASKQLAPGVPYTHLLTAIARRRSRDTLTAK